MKDLTVDLGDLARHDAYIDGTWTAAANGARFEVTNPATGEVIAQVADLGAAETQTAVAAAVAAFHDWAKLPARKRALILRRWHDLILENTEALALILTTEQGKPLYEAKSEIRSGAAYVEWFAEEAKRHYGEVIPKDSDGRRYLTWHEPVGVVSAVTPWNFPSSMITRKLAPALAAGCTVVLKPSELTPLSALALADLAEHAGVPAGVINVVTGLDAAAIGQVLTTHPDIRKFSFTGSTRVGKMLTAQCASTVKRVSMELGGNAPFLVFEDADLDAAVAGAMGSKFSNAGQMCICTNRILVHENIADAFVEKLAAATARLRPGNGAVRGTSLGPLISDTACANVAGLVEDAVARGAKVVGDEGDAPDTGSFVKPIVLDGVTQDMRVFAEEIFGPVAPVLRFSTEEDAIAMANDTRYGLAAYLFTRDIGRVIRVSEALEFGMVGVNDIAIFPETIPFGGIKESGFGREGSSHGLSEYTEVKYVALGGLGG
ncbi:NAD-dependent succinate-semialdehyde dehydrogenase [Shimia biformata]|uniref:NAD-dependent succinate-semialdehyde dehydrogenase n=1 Tax=Shimia biformata TaxID=1294299 RepID=UPI001950E686|nr:NAD-dependent succinate-semialdehyde dehydrogenase [Shimia biformata]